MDRGFGAVYKATCKSRGGLVAIKMTKSDSTDDTIRHTLITRIPYLHIYQMSTLCFFQIITIRSHTYYTPGQMLERKTFRIALIICVEWNDLSNNAL